MFAFSCRPKNGCAFPASRRCCMTTKQTRTDSQTQTCNIRAHTHTATTGHASNWPAKAWSRNVRQLCRAWVWSGLVWGCHPRDKCNWPKMQRLADSQLRTTTAIFQNEFSKSTAAVKGIHSRLCYTLQGNKKMSMQQILDRFIVPVYILIKYIIFNFK